MNTIPTWEQIKGGLDRLLIALFAVAIGKGWVTASDAANYIAAILAVGAVGYGFWVNRQQAIVQSAVTLAAAPNSPLQGIITTNTPEGKQLAANTPGPIEPAGSTAATEIAKS